MATGDTSEFSNAVVVVNPFVVTNTNDSGIGSLRQAILTANREAGLNTITFAIPRGSAHHQPGLTSADDYRPGDHRRHHPAGLRRHPAVIELDGSSAGTTANGLMITAGCSTVSGLVINRLAVSESGELAVKI